MSDDYDRTSYAPFVMFGENDKYSLLLSDNHMVEKSAIFEAHGDGWLGNGYDWNSIAQVVMAERLPELDDELGFDPEAGTFCAYGPRAPLEKLAAEMHKAFHNDDQLRDLLSRAELD
jgi:hypothetical protein